MNITKMRKQLERGRGQIPPRRYVTITGWGDMDEHGAHPPINATVAEDGTLTVTHKEPGIDRMTVFPARPAAFYGEIAAMRQADLLGVRYVTPELIRDHPELGYRLEHP